MPGFRVEDRALIIRLHELVFHDDAITLLLEEAFARAYSRFEDAAYLLPYAGENLQPEPFQCKLPPSLRDHVRLCRVFVLKSGVRAPLPEIHRNSIQRLVSYKNEGAIHSVHPGGPDKHYTAYPLISPVPEKMAEISLYWDVVPAGTWHFPEAGDSADWMTVTFHSAGADEIIEEYASACCRMVDQGAML